MMKYLIKFSKNGYIRYTSHLDMMRLFQRSFKRAGIPLAYSQGFHPHPKMSIAQPLSLGFVSDGEYIEITTENPVNPDLMRDKLNAVMPEGLEILLAKPIPPGTKSLAALIEYGAYEICFALPTQDDKSIDLTHLREKTSSFICQNEILTKKVQKKTEKEVVIDLKTFIYNNNLELDCLELNGNISPVSEDVDSNFYMLSCILKTGSIVNINPELLLKEFFPYLEIKPLEGSILIRRKDLYYLIGNKLDSLANV